MRDRLIELLKETFEYTRGTCIDFDESAEINADNLLANGVIVPPCKVGQTVYKICPKCNKDHNGTCERCAWRGCHMTGCDVGVRVWRGGSHGEYDLQIVPRKVTENSIITIFEWWNIMYFATEEEANTAKEEYDAIRKIADRNERYETYKAWEEKREMRYAFLEDERR